MTEDWKAKLPKGAHPTAIRGDDEGVDRIEIDTVPRFKTSGLSGDQWRVSARIRFFRKGAVVGEEHYNKLQYALAFLPGDFIKLPEQSKVALWGMDPNLCFQPGCAEPAISTYLLQKEFCVGGGNCGQEKGSFSPQYRRFCARHLERGDAGLEDADDNYTVLDGPGPRDRPVAASDQSPSAFGGVINVGAFSEP